MTPKDGEGRYVSGATRQARAYLKAAHDYPSKMSAEDIEWLHRKPYDPRPGHEQFYLQMYSIMNLVRAMDITHGGRVLEAGSGPGWVTEILMLLGYQVDGVEPCQPLVSVAQERIENARQHYRLENPPRVQFHVTSFEKCAFPEESFDAVVFHDALHHMIDEREVFARAYRLLRPGGVLGVSEEAWRPGNREQESILDEEMEQFGTLESPYTQEYLDALLNESGFTDIERYHSINGFFPQDMGAMTLENAAQSRASGSNNLTARKSSWRGPTTANSEARTQAEITILESAFVQKDRAVSMKVRLRNIGETAWLHRPRKAGWVTIALRSSGRDAEAAPRHRLGGTVAPGAAVALDLSFFLPEDYSRYRWHLDLVNEGFFWFSERGTGTPEVPIR